MFDDFIELNSQDGRGVGQQQSDSAAKINCYCFMPHLAWVEKLITQMPATPGGHWYLRESLVLFGSQVDRLWARRQFVFVHGDDNGDRGTTENLMYLVALL